MNKIISIILFFTVFGADFGNISGQQIPSPEVLAQSNQIPQLPGKDYQETPLRRAEIVFFISVPFTAVLSFLAANVFYAVTNPKYLSNLSMSNLPPEILPFSVVSALFTSGMITYGDYLFTQKKAEEQQKIQGENNANKEIKIGIALEKKF